MPNWSLQFTFQLLPSLFSFCLYLFYILTTPGIFFYFFNKLHNEEFCIIQYIIVFAKSPLYYQIKRIFPHWNHGMSSSFSIVVCIVGDSMNVNWITIERRWKDSITLILFPPCIIVSLFGFLIYAIDRIFMCQAPFFILYFQLLYCDYYYTLNIEGRLFFVSNDYLSRLIVGIPASTEREDQNDLANMF